MRLLNTASLRVESFPDNAIPPYAILSHVWGPAKDEVTFQDMQDGVAEQKSGYVKLQRSSAIARQNNLDYIWIDTCCIDKSSSAELSESINSMFRYYAKAETCYAFLADVSTLPGMPDFGTLLQASKWFTRGWTVQELVAPRELVFLNSSWAVLGTKDVFAERIADITNIDVMILSNPSQLQKASVAKRMSWASKRVTTREEDMAYCLLGVFDVNMPLLYGEGRKAFVRLQEEILKSSTDQSLFSWTPDATRYANQEHSGATGVLAQHPSEFAQTSHIVPFGANTNPYAMTNKGLQITLPILRHRGFIWHQGVRESFAFHRSFHRNCSIAKNVLDSERG
ncbi:HET-domain-containing protein [Tothia fuscella]|uniref:HET-domain-containing protein n=1 Tax=Tothia fuscella TaxID=1048955 RepID=A0A9P4P020_9PEZI|nr:HET-domain-containing protein [Tothia fuscella]